MITVLLSAQKNIALTLSVYRFDTKTETVYLSLRSHALFILFAWVCFPSLLCNVNGLMKL